MNWFHRYLSLQNLDRRVLYVAVFLALSIPIACKMELRPAEMHSANDAYAAISNLSPGKAVFISLDFGPNSLAENMPQAEVVIEHLFRLNVPMIFYSQYPLASGFLEELPTTIAKKLSPARAYGVDWVNIGYRPTPDVFLQGLAASDDWASYLKRDARGNRLSDLPLFGQIRGLQDIQAVVQLTSLVGTLDSFLRFFQRADARPKLIHGCTSITIPQAYIYLDSGQLSGLLEGIAGAAWYSHLLNEQYPNRPVDRALSVNTGLAVAHVVIILLVMLGNLSAFFARRAV